MKRMHLTALLAAGAVATLSACATLVTGRDQLVSFNSNPAGATVSVDGRVLGETPLSLALQKRANQRLVFKKDGFTPVEMSLDTTVNPWFFGNILIGGLLGSTTDGASGSVYRYSPSYYMVSLQKEGINDFENAAHRTRRQETIDFVVTGYRSLADDLQAGDGPYLMSLLQILGVGEAERTETAKKVKALFEIYPAIPDFAERVADLSVDAD